MLAAAPFRISSPLRPFYDDLVNVLGVFTLDVLDVMPLGSHAGAPIRGMASRSALCQLLAKALYSD